MPEPTAQEQADWKRTQGSKPYPGSPEPIAGRCAANVVGQNKGLRDIGATTARYCKRYCGSGTDHVGIGTCSWHLGNTVPHIRNAERVKLEKDYQSLSSRLKDAVAPGEPEVMMAKMAGIAWEWYQFMIGKMDEIEDSLVNTDNAGVEHSRALLEAFERAGAQSFEIIKFMAQHKLAERLVALEEHQARYIATIFLDIINDYRLPLADGDREYAKKRFALGMEKAGSQLTPSWAAAEDIIDAVSYPEGHAG